MGKEFKNEFAWSKSRNEIFRECLRKYYYNHYGFWDGWKQNASRASQELYRLKQLKNVHIWVGEVVHSVITDILAHAESGGLVSLVDSIIEDTKDKMGRAFHISHKGPYFETSPKNYLRLSEHEYNQPVNLADALQKMETCVSNFCSDELIKTVSTLPRENILRIPEFDSVEIEGIKVMATPDYVYRNATSPNELVLLEWKSGKSGESHEFQVDCYAAYALRKWKPHKITTTLHYLLDSQKINSVASIIDIKRAEREIVTSATEMKKLLVNSEDNIANIEDFPKTVNAYACERCNYQKYCIKA